MTPDLLHLEDQMRRIFRDRFSLASLEDDDLYFVVDTRHEPITGAEVARIATLLDVPLDRIRLHDLPPDAVRFIVDVTPVTAPHTLSALERNRP